MRNFQDTFETHKQSLITLSICMTVPLRALHKLENGNFKIFFYFFATSFIIGTGNILCFKKM